MTFIKQDGSKKNIKKYLWSDSSVSADPVDERADLFENAWWSSNSAASLRLEKLFFTIIFQTSLLK